MSNLINLGILPLVFADESDADRIDIGDRLVLEDARAKVGAESVFAVRK